jgi:hypothetical protein
MVVVFSDRDDVRRRPRAVAAPKTSASAPTGAQRTSPPIDVSRRALSSDYLQNLPVRSIHHVFLEHPQGHRPHCVHAI